MRVKLGEVCRFINGDRGKNYPSQDEISNEGDVPFINAGHIDEGKLNFTEMNYISKEKYDQLNSGKIQENDVLYCLRGSLGKKTIVKDISVGAIASSLVIIRPDADKIDSDYLYYALESPTVKKQMIRANNGSSQPNLSAKSVSEYTFNLPDINTQRIVVSKLGIVTYLIALRKQQLSKLDELVKARFVELVHENATTPIKLMSVVEDERIITYGIVKPGEHTIGGVPIIKVKDFPKGVILMDDMLLASRDIESKYKRSRVKEGDLLFSIRGSVGRTAFVPKELVDANITQDTARISVSERYNPHYVRMALEYEPVQQSINEHVRGVAVKGISLAELREIEIPVVEKALQDSFGRFVEQTDKSKVVVQKSLEQLKTLKKALMQKYFG